MIPGLGSSPGEGKGYPLQYSGLENSKDCIVHGVSKSQTRLSNFHFSCHTGEAKIPLCALARPSRSQREGGFLKKASSLHPPM